MQLGFRFFMDDSSMDLCEDKESLFGEHINFGAWEMDNHASHKLHHPPSAKAKTSLFLNGI